MDDVLTLTCQFCYYVGETVELDGFYYCSSCGEQNLDVVDTGAEEGEGIGGGIYLASHQRSQPIPAKPVSQYNTQSSQSSYRRKLGLETDEENVDRFQFDEASPWEPEDFGSKVVNSEDYHKEIRLRYVLGLQLMIQLQCEALVKEFKVTPLICGLVGPIWLRLITHLQKEGNNMKFSFLVYISKFTCTLQLVYPYLYEEINFMLIKCLILFFQHQKFDLVSSCWKIFSFLV
jgi:hypothetical protein